MEPGGIGEQYDESVLTGDLRNRSHICICFRLCAMHDILRN